MVCDLHRIYIWARSGHYANVARRGQRHGQGKGGSLRSYSAILEICLARLLDPSQSRTKPPWPRHEGVTPGSSLCREWWERPHVHAHVVLALQREVGKTTCARATCCIGFEQRGGKGHRCTCDVLYWLCRERWERPQVRAHVALAILRHGLALEQDVAGSTGAQGAAAAWMLPVKLRSKGKFRLLPPAPPYYPFPRGKSILGVL